MLSLHTPTGPRPGGKSYISPEGIIHCTDGKLRWVYELDQRKKPTILLSLLWKFMTVGAIAGLLILLIRLGSHGTAALGIGLLLTLALTAAGALLSLGVFAARILHNGPAVCFLFTMDADMVSRQQVRGKASKEKVVHAIAAWVGGQSQPSLRFYDPHVSHFDTVTAIKADSHHQRIRVSSVEGSNTVYAEPEQFQLVLDYLRAQCPQAK